MEITFVVCKTPSAKAADVLAKVLGPSKVIACDVLDGKLESCGSVAILCSFAHGQIESEVLECISRCSEPLKAKKVALIGETGAAKDAVQKLAEQLGTCVVWAGCIDMDTGSQIRTDETASQFTAIKRKLKDFTDMPRDLLWQEIEQFLKAHNTCALCTGQGNSLRVTPIEYLYTSDAIYFLSEGGEKFAHLFANPYASMAVYDSYTGFTSLGGLQIEGSIQMISFLSEEYKQAVTKKGLNAQKMQKLPVILHMFKLVPKRFDLLESSLTKKGYQAKQTLEISE